MPELSIIIPVYNRQVSAIRALESVLEQGVEAIEVLIVDDGSSPPIQLPLQYASDRRIQLLTRPTNRGAAAARNTGMREACGDWVAFLDSDDRWLPGTLAPRLMHAREGLRVAGNPLTVRVAGFRLMGPLRGHSDVRIPAPSVDVLDFASGCWFSPGSTALFLRKPILERVGGQDEELRRFEDVDWFLRIAMAGGGIVTDHIIAAEIEVARRPTVDAVDRDGSLILRKYASRTNDEMGRRISRQLRAWLTFERASAYWNAGQYWGTAVNLARSWWWEPRWHLYLRKFWTA